MDLVISTRLDRDPAYPSTRRSRVLTTVVSTAFVLTGVVTTFLGPILPALASRWELSDSRSGYFFTAQFLGAMLGVGISSLLLRRIGFRFSIGIAYFLMGVRGGVKNFGFLLGIASCDCALHTGNSGTQQSRARFYSCVGWAAFAFHGQLGTCTEKRIAG